MICSPIVLSKVFHRFVDKKTMLYTKEKAQAMLELIVAEKGFEPMTFGL